MTLPLRIVLTAFLIGIFLFCAFGLQATIEPGDQSVRMAFRLIYGMAAVASVSGFVALWRKKSENNETD